MGKGARNIAALYVETDGCYFGLPGVDPWDEKRDARTYAGPHPVVAHPPCQRWGKLWAGQPLHIKRTGERKKKGDDGGCFKAALASVREHGGVIEHPWGSHAWPHFGLKVPPRSGGWVRADDFGGWTCCVEQGRYGHYARKPTLLLVYGIVDLPELEWGVGELRLDPAVVARMGLKRAKRLGEVGARGGGKDSTPRIGTPEPFRELLIGMARSVRADYAANSAKSILQTTIQKNTKGKSNHASSKENPVSINFTITAGTAEELAHEIGALARLLGGVAPIAAEPVVEAAKPRAPRKKAETVIEHDPKEVKTDAIHGAGEGTDSAGSGDVPVRTVEPDAADEVAAVEEPAVEPAAETPALTIDELRIFTISSYLNVVFDEQAARKDAFGELLKAFGVTALKELPADKINAFKAEVDARIAKAVTK